MQQHLISDQLTISINHLGAELCSVKNTNGLEFIWQADKDVWARHAPALFPIVGKLKHNQFIFNDKIYTLGQHGFARDREFALLKKNETSCTFLLKSNEKDKAGYPFDFEFQVGYLLDKNTLVINYTVLNPSRDAIFFSVGGHPGFNCPLSKNEKFEDYFLEFESSSNTITELNNGLRLSAKRSLILKDNKLFLSEALFDKDALVFENNQINFIRLCSSKSTHRITLNCKGWPYFGIWSKKGSTNFICMEPWFGIADPENSNQEFVQKEGIIKLEPKKEFNCSFSITFA